MLDLLNQIDSFVWGPPLLILLVGTGIWLTIRLNLIQIFKLIPALKLIFGAKSEGEGDVSSFKALCKDIVLEIEVQGALLVKEKCPNALLVFVAPPSWEELRDRLVGRGTEDAATIENRLNIARGELKQAVHYDYILVNDTVEAAAQRLEHIIEAGRCRNIEMKDFIEEVEHHA